MPASLTMKFGLRIVTSPMTTLVTVSNRSPVTVTVVPPASGPTGGLTSVMLGGNAVIIRRPLTILGELPFV
ncbi:unannotated protein [freshwater metagenome]|uniref:Unannotated protein n=1 Tax=freshwater metagenome TaxID=449393 RepID=A0A6J5YYV7_9ZZZZ